MIIKTRVYEMANGRYQSLSDLARAMGLSISQVYRVRDGKRGINEKFILGAKKAFPECRLDELFYFHKEKVLKTPVKTSAKTPAKSPALGNYSERLRKSLETD